VISRDRVVPPLLALAAFLAGWQLLVFVGNYPPFILPGPLVVGERFVAAWTDGTMEPHVAMTLAEIGIGFAGGAIAGMLAGYILARSSLANRVAWPFTGSTGGSWRWPAATGSPAASASAWSSCPRHCRASWAGSASA
jgi:ABC-type nitrate/sulfonate/bicarbonate transport system permease component